MMNNSRDTAASAKGNPPLAYTAPSSADTTTVTARSAAIDSSTASSQLLREDVRSIVASAMASLETLKATREEIMRRGEAAVGGGSSPSSAVRLSGAAQTSSSSAAPPSSAATLSAAAIRKEGTVVSGRAALIDDVIPSPERGGGGGAGRDRRHRELAGGSRRNDGRRTDRGTMDRNAEAEAPRRRGRNVSFHDDDDVDNEEASHEEEDGARHTDDDDDSEGDHHYHDGEGKSHRGSSSRRYGRGPNDGFTPATHHHRQRYSGDYRQNRYVYANDSGTTDPTGTSAYTTTDATASTDASAFDYIYEGKHGDGRDRSRRPPQRSPAEDRHRGDGGRRAPREAEEDSHGYGEERGRGGADAGGHRRRHRQEYDTEEEAHNFAYNEGRPSRHSSAPPPQRPAATIRYASDFGKRLGAQSRDLFGASPSSVSPSKNSSARRPDAKERDTNRAASSGHRHFASPSSAGHDHGYGGHNKALGTRGVAKEAFSSSRYTTSTTRQVKHSSSTAAATSHPPQHHRSTRNGGDDRYGRSHTAIRNDDDDAPPSTVEGSLVSDDDGGYNGHRGHLTAGPPPRDGGSSKTHASASSTSTTLHAETVAALQLALQEKEAALSEAQRAVAALTDEAQDLTSRLSAAAIAGRQKDLDSDAAIAGLRVAHQTELTATVADLTAAKHKAVETATAALQKTHSEEAARLQSELAAAKASAADVTRRFQQFRKDHGAQKEKIAALEADAERQAKELEARHRKAEELARAVKDGKHHRRIAEEQLLARAHEAEVAAAQLTAAEARAADLAAQLRACEEGSKSFEAQAAEELKRLSRLFDESRSAHEARLAEAAAKVERHERLKAKARDLKAKTVSDASLLEALKQQLTRAEEELTRLQTVFEASQEGAAEERAALEEALRVEREGYQSFLQQTDETLAAVHSEYSDKFDLLKTQCEKLDVALQHCQKELAAEQSAYEEAERTIAGLRHQLEATAERQRLAEVLAKEKFEVYKQHTNDTIAALKKQIGDKDRRSEQLAALSSSTSETVQRLRDQLADERARSAGLEAQMREVKGLARRVGDNLQREVRRSEIRNLAAYHSSTATATAASSSVAGGGGGMLLAIGGGGGGGTVVLHHHNEPSALSSPPNSDDFAVASPPPRPTALVPSSSAGGVDASAAPTSASLSSAPALGVNASGRHVALAAPPAAARHIEYSNTPLHSTDNGHAGAMASADGASVLAGAGTGLIAASAAILQQQQHSGAFNAPIAAPITTSSAPVGPSLVAPHRSVVGPSAVAAIMNSPQQEVRGGNAPVTEVRSRSQSASARAPTLPPPSSGSAARGSSVASAHVPTSSVTTVISSSSSSSQQQQQQGIAAHHSLHEAQMSRFREQTSQLYAKLSPPQPSSSAAATLGVEGSVADADEAFRQQCIASVRGIDYTVGGRGGVGGGAGAGTVPLPKNTIGSSDEEDAYEDYDDDEDDAYLYGGDGGHAKEGAGGGSAYASSYTS